MGYFYRFSASRSFRGEEVKRGGRGTFDLYAKFAPPYRSLSLCSSRPSFCSSAQHLALFFSRLPSLVLSVIPARMISHGLASRASEDHALTLCCSSPAPGLANRMDAICYASLGLVQDTLFVHANDQGIILPVYR